MCGICGIYNFKDKDKAQSMIERMLTSMKHRGPDDEGIYMDDYMSMGHRRLSIIDVKGGHQPLFNEDENICLVFNGEIYNFRELRKKIRAST